MDVYSHILSKCFSFKCFNSKQFKLNKLVCAWFFIFNFLNLQEGRIYLLSHFYVRPVPKSKACGDSQFEIELRSDSKMELVEDIPDFPELAEESFTPISKLKLLQDDQKACKLFKCYFIFPLTFCHSISFYSFYQLS